MRFTMDEDDRGMFCRVICADGAVFLIDASDINTLREWEWRCRKTNTKARSAYVVRTGQIAGKSRIILLHREILQAPKGLTVDHRNGDGLNNRRHNLRLATQRQNVCSVQKPPRNATASGYRGVYANEYGRFYASISICKRVRYLGSFDTPEDAAHAYDAAAVAYRGEFTFLNFPTMRISGT